jgi:hypothetical protein
MLRLVFKGGIERRRVCEVGMDSGECRWQRSIKCKRHQGFLARSFGGVLKLRRSEKQGYLAEMGHSITDDSKNCRNIIILALVCTVSQLSAQLSPFRICSLSSNVPARSCQQQEYATLNHVQ